MYLMLYQQRIFHPPIRDICYAFIRHSLCVKRICKLDGLSRVYPATSC